MIVRIVVIRDDYAEDDDVDDDDDDFFVSVRGRHMGSIQSEASPRYAVDAHHKFNAVDAYHKFNAVDARGFNAVEA